MLHARLLPYIALAKRYEEEEAQVKARQAIPLSQLMVCAQQKADDMINCTNKTPESSTLLNKPALLKHCLLLELLKWFKTEFFQWFDRENCSACADVKCNAVQHNTLCIPTADERRFGGDRIEVYQCPQCRQHYRFPRYNDPLKLLETRRGRCGEWANAFTLCCRACGFDARFVLDFTDHVWTEVWSDLEGRWLHCDPCENVCDKPLLYEAGWGKELSYVFAFSRDELVDVTWRYTSKPLVLKRRRTLMNESQLLYQIQMLNADFFTPVVPPHRANIALQRRVGEVVEFLNCTGRTASNAEQHGRSSGSLAWRLARGETTTAADSSKSNCVDKKFVFDPDEKPVDADVETIRIVYDVIKNKYTGYRNDRLADSYGRWADCVYFAQNIERKEENDWKMAYLCRADGSDAKTDGIIEWRFRMPRLSGRESGSNLKVGKVLLHARNTACFETGLVKWHIAALDERSMEGDNSEKLTNAKSKSVAVDSEALENGYDCTELLQDALTLAVSATLSGGRGSIGWQQAQLFRSSTKSNPDAVSENAGQFSVTFHIQH